MRAMIIIDLYIVRSSFLVLQIKDLNGLFVIVFFILFLFLFLFFFFFFFFFFLLYIYTQVDLLVSYLDTHLINSCKFCFPHFQEVGRVVILFRDFGRKVRTWVL